MLADWLPWVIRHVATRESTAGDLASGSMDKRGPPSLSGFSAKGRGSVPRPGRDQVQAYADESANGRQSGFSTWIARFPKRSTFVVPCIPDAPGRRRKLNGRWPAIPEGRTHVVGGQATPTSNLAKTPKLRRKNQRQGASAGQGRWRPAD